MASWEGMTAEEREKYANQDSVDLSWREILNGSYDRQGQQGIDGCNEHVGLADMITSDTYLPDGLFDTIIDPVGMACLRMFYVEGMTAGQVAEAVTVSHLSNGKVIHSIPLTRFAVECKLKRARVKLKLYWSNDQVSLLVKD